MIFKIHRADIVRLAALVLVITVTWCVIHNRTTARNWRVPLFIASDGLSLLALEKSAAEGDFRPIVLKFNPHLGAPYRANWNDFPLTEEPLITAAGLLTRCIGLFVASNLLVLLAHILAALSFFIVCRVLAYRWQWAFVASLAFSLSHYAFQRGFPHLPLTFYWHIPLCLLVCAWSGSRHGLGLYGRKCWLALGIGLITGVQNPYYTNAFLHFLGFAAIAQTVRRQPWTTIVAPLLVGTAAVTGLLLMNLDTLYYQTIHGKNIEAAGRSYQSVEIYSLKPLDLLVPPPDHRSSFARKTAWDYMYDEAKKIQVHGELFSPYLGLTGIGALLWLGIVCVIRVSRWPIQPIPVPALQTLWLILYSVMGGVNGFLGQAGICLFRCANRYSIYILAIVLLFAVKELSRLGRSWRPALVTSMAALLSVLVLWDQLPLQETQTSINQTKTLIASDRAFTIVLEKALPPHAMIFQLPVMKYPESWPIEQMGDYEHLRPYLYSRDLHFSYGNDKGRGEDDWQVEVGRQPPPEMVALLERVGFNAIYINRKGYADNGFALIDGLQKAGRSRIIESPAHDLVAVLLTPATDPVMPETPPAFKHGWYAEESSAQGNTWHYGKGNAELILSNSSSASYTVRVHFELASPSPRTVEIWQGNTQLYRSPSLTSAKTVVSLLIELLPGETTLLFKTEPAVVFPGNPDTRLLGFLLYNLHVIKEPDDS